ncbi:trypsin-2 [Drosophila bipectinata]|uniref:trypsin-2 n=1 Tax=Drosophila bipectinata TaxID=42026 RepID=UPI0038B2B1C0
MALLLNKFLLHKLCSFLLFFLLFKLISTKSVKRVKRLSSPFYDEEKIEGLSKYVVSIRSRTPSKFFGDNHFCAGVIISKEFILTSAHCTMDKRKIIYRSRVLSVIAGTENRLKYRPNTSINLPVKRVFVPENFTLQNTNNIALMKLGEPLPTDNPYVGIINLPTTEPQRGLNYTVMGWGRMYKGGPMSAKLLYIDVELLPREECERLLNVFKEEMMCAGNLHNNLDENPCAGDTGGPLILNETVYGIVSYRIGCGSKDLPSVYTDVHAHAKWIQDTMLQNGCRSLKSFLYLVLASTYCSVMRNRSMNSFAGFYFIKNYLF